MSICIVIPVYNAFDDVFRCVASIINQTRLPDQVVFVDDGSTHTTSMALRTSQSYLSKAGISCDIISHTTNLGRGAARNSGLDAVKTRAMCWLDIDDLFHFNRIESLFLAMDALEEANLSQPTLFSSPHLRCRSRNEPNSATIIDAIETISFEEFFRRNQPTPLLQATAGLTKVFRKIRFDQTLNWAEDYDFALRFLSSGGRYLAEPGSRAKNICYFHSTDGNRSVVIDANARVLTKNEAHIKNLGLNVETIFARKWLRYISRFPSQNAIVPRKGSCASESEMDLEKGFPMALKDVKQFFRNLSNGESETDDESSIEAPSLPVFISRYSRDAGHQGAIIVSFFGGAEIYQRNAARLSEKLSHYNVDYDICEYIPNSGEQWINICRKKISFMIQQSKKYNRPIFWIDVDAQLLRDPTELLLSNADFGAFLRNFRNLRSFDPAQSARFFHPGYILFGNSERSQRFLQNLAEFDADAPVNATDDYVLQEAFQSDSADLRVSVFSSQDVATSNDDPRLTTAFFLHTDSGNVHDQRHVAAQHGAENMSTTRQVQVLKFIAAEALEKGKLEDAAVFYKKIRQLAPHDAETLTKLMSIYNKLGEKKKYEFFLSVGLKDATLRSAVLKFDIDRKFSEKKLDAAAQSMIRLLESGSKNDENFVKSRRYRHSFDFEAKKRNIADEERINMMWWEQPFPGNLGDIIGPYIINSLSGIPPRYSKKSPRVLSVGSIIKFARTGDTVWGSGASARSQKIDPNVEFKAVRGPLTRQMVIEAGGKCPEVYGDPAWFLPKIFDCSKIKKKYRLGLIRHFSHATRNILVDDDVLEIDIIRSSRGEIESFLQEMNSCDSIISTSLHGLIIAHAYNIPVALAIDSSSASQIHGDGMKFTDYFLSVGVMRAIAPIDLGAVERVSTSMRSICEHNPERPIDLKVLAEVAPFNVNGVT